MSRKERGARTDNSKAVRQSLEAIVSRTARGLGSALIKGWGFAAAHRGRGAGARSDWPSGHERRETHAPAARRATHLGCFRDALLSLPKSGKPDLGGLRFGHACGASKPSTVPKVSTSLGTLFGLLLPHAAQNCNKTSIL